MAIDFSSLGATPAHTGKIDFSAIGGVPAVGQDEPTDDTTALGAAGRGAVGMIPMGEQAYSGITSAMDNKPYAESRQDLEKQIAADKENHGVARFAGQAAGVVAPAILTGGATAPESLLGAAGQGAAVGAGFGAGNAIDTLAEGGSGAKAAGDVALGAGLGAAGGAIGQKIGGLMGKAVPGIEGYAARKAGSAVGIGSDELGTMSQPETIALGKMLMAKGIVKQGASTQEMFDTAKALQEQYGNQIGQIGNKATELGLTTDTKPLLEALGEKYKLSSQLKNPDEMRNANFYQKGMADIQAMANRNGAERVAPDILTDQPNSFITFDQLQQLKKSYGSSAFMNGTVKNPAAADVYSQLSGGQKAIVNKVGATPGLPAQLRDAMSNYAQLHPVVDGLQDVLGRERAGNLPAKGFGMMGKLIGQMPGQKSPPVNILTALGLMGMGHPMWAAGAITATTSNPAVMAPAIQGVANAIPGIAERLPGMASQMMGGEAPAPAMNHMAGHVIGEGIHHTAASAIEQAQPDPTDIQKLLNHPALAKYRPDFAKGAAAAKTSAEAETAVARTDFVKQQSNPGYAEARQKAIDEPVTGGTQPGITKMADGGIVNGGADSAIQNGVPGDASTLPGMENVIEKASKGSYRAPVRTAAPAGQAHQPFNGDMADKLRAFLAARKDESNATH